MGQLNFVLLGLVVSLGTLIQAPRSLCNPISQPADEPRSGDRDSEGGDASAKPFNLAPQKPRYILVEEFTAATLPKAELKIGTDFDGGITDHLMVGTDMTALAVGVATFQTKYQFYGSHRHSLALGLKFAALDRKSLLWGSAREHFTSISARTIRPSLSWTHQISPRLKLHTFWAKGLGKVRLKLSEKGRRKLWATKHPGSDYETRDEATQVPTKQPTAEGTETLPDGADTGSKENQEKTASETSTLTAQSLQVQSVSGLSQERFQLTGELSRQGGNKVLISTRIERNDIEELKSNFFRITAAHQWIRPFFQIRLGAGLQYYVLSGRDLDGELIDTAGVQPASDITFYWRT